MVELVVATEPPPPKRRKRRLGHESYRQPAARWRELLAR
jgi:hypothetical protein